MAGQERFRAVTTHFFRGAAGGLLVYDTTNRESFEHIVSWMTEARSRARPEAVFTLVGAKSDLAAAREVTALEAATFAQENDLLFIECSARTGDNVDELFTKLTAGILRKAEQNHEMEDASGDNGVDIGKQDEAVGFCRC
jgi:Ras-related protein Rab-4B/Ras-related protein Rab-14